MPAGLTTPPVSLADGTAGTPGVAAARDGEGEGGCGRGGVRAQQLQPRYPVLNPIKEQPRIPELLPHVAQLGTERAGLFPGAAFLQRLVWLEISGGKRPTAVDAEGVADVVFTPALGAFYSGWSVLAGHQSQAL